MQWFISVIKIYVFIIFHVFGMYKNGSLLVLKNMNLDVCFLHFLQMFFIHLYFKIHCICRIWYLHFYVFKILINFKSGIPVLDMSLSLWCVTPLLVSHITYTNSCLFCQLNAIEMTYNEDISDNYLTFCFIFCTFIYTNKLVSLQC